MIRVKYTKDGKILADIDDIITIVDEDDWHHPIRQFVARWVKQGNQIEPYEPVGCCPTK